ncbi:MAG: MFS transporter [Thermoplasmatales archaeon]
MKKGNPIYAFPDAKQKAFVELSETEKRILSRHQKTIITWSIIASFSYALIWYWFPSVDSFIGAQFSLSAFQIGLLISSFGAAFILTNFLWGHLNDEYWPNRTVTVGLIIAGLSTFLFVRSTDIQEMYMYRVLEGVFNGAAWSGLVKTVQLWFPIEKRSKYISVFVAIYSWAISVDLFAGIHVASAYSWMLWAEIVGTIGIISGITTYFMAKPFGPMIGLPLIEWGDVSPIHKLKFKTSARALFRQKWMILAILSGLVVIGGANIISGIYLQQVLPTIQGIPISQIAILGTVWGAMQGVLILVFGHLSDKYRRRVLFVKLGLLGAFISMIGVVLTIVFHPLPMYLIYLITISTGTPFLIAGPIFALLGDRYGVLLVGAAAAYFEGFGTGGGAFLLPLLLGYMTAPFGMAVAWGVIAAIFLVVFLAWLPQKEYKITNSLVDIHTLNMEKAEKRMELGIAIEDSMDKYEGE